MERLTFSRTNRFGEHVFVHGDDCSYNAFSFATDADGRKVLERAFEKLKAYEDAEEQGLLLRLPCKVGDTVYVITSREVTESVVFRITIDSSDSTKILVTVPVHDWQQIRTFGKTVFLAKEEAEQALAEMEK